MLVQEENPQSKKLELLPQTYNLEVNSQKELKKKATNNPADDEFEQLKREVVTLKSTLLQRDSEYSKLQGENEQLRQDNQKLNNSTNEAIPIPNSSFKKLVTEEFVIDTTDFVHEDNGSDEESEKGNE